jgi:hypothetical protein
MRRGFHEKGLTEAPRQFGAFEGQIFRLRKVSEEFFEEGGADEASEEVFD